MIKHFLFQFIAHHHLNNHLLSGFPLRFSQKSDANYLSFYPSIIFSSRFSFNSSPQFGGIFVYFVISSRKPPVALNRSYFGVKPLSICCSNFANSWVRLNLDTSSWLLKVVSSLFATPRKSSKAAICSFHLFSSYSFARFSWVFLGVAPNFCMYSWLTSLCWWTSYLRLYVSSVRSSIYLLSLPIYS